jgi:flagella basal body P-ring formation protein FlgA
MLLRRHFDKKDYLVALVLAIALWSGVLVGLFLLREASAASRVFGPIIHPRVGGAISPDVIEALISSDLDDRGYAGERQETFPEPIGEVAYLPEETGFRLTSTSSSARIGPVSFYIEVMAHDRINRTIPITVFVKLFRQQVVARHTLARGQTVAPGDVEVVRVEVTHPEEMGFGSIEDVVGMRARRNLPGGWALTSRDVERAPAVLRGQRIRVAYKKGPIRATASVEVKADGWVGDAVPVVNVESRRGFVALVTGPGTLQVGGGQ